MRFAWLYALMVGGPLLALALVLRVGERLDAPASVGGTWSLDTEPPLEVVQSGPLLELRRGDDRGRGRLEGDAVEGRLGAWTLRARREGPDRLTGSFSAGTAPLTTFVAVRRQRPRGAPGGH